MFRKFLITIVGAALFLLTACGESEPVPVQGNEFVESVEMDLAINSWTGLRCAEGYQTFDIDSLRQPDYNVLGMKVSVQEEGDFYPDDEKTEEYEGFYAQDWASIKMKLLPDVELPVIIIHSTNSSYYNEDDQTVAPLISAGRLVDMRFATDNFVGGAGRITGLTLCMKVAS